MTNSDHPGGRRRRAPRQEAAAIIDWTVPPERPNWLLGTGTTPTERYVVWAATALLTALVVIVADVSWTAWQWAVVVVLTFDVAGGVVANSLGTAKRFYHSPPPATAGRVVRAVHHPVGFAAVHVQPFVLAAVVPDAGWTWAATWWAAALSGVVLVVSTPLYLRRAVAGGVVTMALVAAPLVTDPAGLAWFGPVVVLKLVGAHAVREEPYRPAPPGSAQTGSTT